METELIYKQEYFRIMGLCMEIHRNLGGGLLEIVYKDALAYELKQNKIPFEREREYLVEYKGIILPHRFYADFVVYDNIILEVKAMKGIADEHVAQTINYAKLAKSRLGIIANFGDSLQHKRLIVGY